MGGKAPEDAQKLEKFAADRFKELYLKVLSEGGESVVKVGAGTHILLTNWLSDFDAWRLIKDTMFWNGAREAARDMLR